VAPPFGSGLTGNISADLYDCATLTKQIPLPIETMNATLYYNQVGSWMCTMKFDEEIWDIMQTFIADEGFVVWFNWGGQVHFGGKCEIPGYQDSVPGANNAAVFTTGTQIVCTGATLEALIANRLAFPAPTLAWGAQTYGANDPVSAVACETAIKHYVVNNLGASAAAARRFPLLTVATNLARGSAVVSYNVKFAQGVDLGLMDIIRNLVATGGPMGVEVMLNNGGLGMTFDVYVPQDLTGFAYFSKEVGNLTSVGLQIEDPSVTDACVLGSATPILVTGDGTANPWTKIEQLVDQASSSDATQNTQAGQQAVAQGVMTPSLQMSAQDIPKLKFGTDYYLGDKVTVEVASGDRFQDIVSQVNFTMDGSASPPVSVIPVIGIPSNSGNSTTSATAQLVNRVRRLERLLSARIG
jgi:hypothetical protein